MYDAQFLRNRSRIEACTGGGGFRNTLVKGLLKTRRSALGTVGVVERSLAPSFLRGACELTYVDRRYYGITVSPVIMR